MQYFHEMLSKYGFADGKAIPPDAPERREVYVRYLNSAGRARNSAVRAAIYNRPGLHNYYLILFYPLQTILAYTTPDELDDFCVSAEVAFGPHPLHQTGSCDMDEPLREAIEIAIEEDELDYAVYTETTIDRERLADIIAQLQGAVSEAMPKAIASGQPSQ